MEMTAPGRAGNHALGVSPFPEEFAHQAGTVNTHPSKERARRMGKGEPGNEFQHAGGVSWAAVPVPSPVCTLVSRQCTLSSLRPVQERQQVRKTLCGPTQ